ncbi:b6 protein [Trichonephila clavata]|uniref:B6 protein n=1 Tax=Trichonephila clavata TaxID=2740835 RepID=A0A8X6M5J5_TRICU|nr:b6 protein [Trichonephila clavata]
MHTKAFLIAGFLMILHTSHGTETILEQESSSNCSSPEESFQTEDTALSGPNLSIGGTTSIFQLFKKFTVPPSIATFVSNFHNIVQSSKTLLNLFDVTDVNLLEFAKCMYEFVLKSANSLDVLNPHLIANHIYQSILSNLDILHSSVMINLYANAMARSLFHEGILNLDNAATLAKKCANDMEAFDKKMVETGNPISKIQDFPAVSSGVLGNLSLPVVDDVPDHLSSFLP